VGVVGGVAVGGENEKMGAREGGVITRDLINSESKHSKIIKEITDCIRFHHELKPPDYTALISTLHHHPS